VLRPVFSALLAAAAGVIVVAQATPPTAPPQFRGGIQVVPVDVRVIDARGNPVTDLKESDFTILENGRPHPLNHFSTVDLSLPVGPRPLAGGQTGEALLESPTRRVFLFVLGRGRLQPPSRGADAAIAFVKKNVLPQDYVAVISWGRATSFTTDHSKTVALLERFKARHEKIEQDLSHYFSGLAAAYAGPDLPAYIQKQVDAVFEEPSSTMTASQPVLTASGAREELAIRNDLMTNEIRAASGGTSMITPIGSDADSARNRIGMEVTFDEFVGLNRQARQDVSNLYAGIAYMRHLAGEKHLIFLTEHGTYLPSADDDRGLASQAADARVALHVMHTGGTLNRGGTLMVGGGFTQTSSRVTQMTGGQFSSTTMGSRFMEQLDRATRFQYLLGYSPANATFDGKFRKIQVRVNRRDVRVFHRQGYFARRTPIGLTPALILAQSRIASAVMTTAIIPDIEVSLTASAPKGAKGATPVTLEIIIKPGRLHTEPAADPALTRLSIEVAMFATDSRSQIVGQSWRTVTTDMTQEALERFRTHGLRLTGTFEATALPKDIKVVVYDQGADLLGTAVTPVR
jgi:VWFA-related protein